MPSLTRRRSDNPHQVTWHVYYGDVHVGKIGERAGVPVDVDPWHWSCGFYPGLHPGQHRYGTAISFEEARAGFEADWNDLLPEIPDGAFEECRREREARAEMRAIQARGSGLFGWLASDYRFEAHHPTTTKSPQIDFHALAKSAFDFSDKNINHAEPRLRSRSLASEDANPAIIFNRTG
jgi:hypothetical protein